jgi:Ice-binding-like
MTSTSAICRANRETHAATNRTRRLFLVLSVGMVLLSTDATAQGTINLGTASSFGILAGSQITDAGGVSSITGDVGLYPAAGAAIGLTPGQVHGTIYKAETSGPFLNGAKNDLTTAYNDAAGRSPTIDYGVTDNQLGGKTLSPGVYRFGHAATANLIGKLTLDANGSLNPVWIFQATSDFITAAGAPGTPGSSIAFLNGANACEVFWQVGSSATIGTYSHFAGTIMADQSISMGTGATLDGSALARIAAVTLDHNTLTICSVPEPSSTLLLACGLTILLVARRQFHRGPKTAPINR